MRCFQWHGPLFHVKMKRVRSSSFGILNMCLNQVKGETIGVLYLTGKRYVHLLISIILMIHDLLNLILICCFQIQGIDKALNDLWPKIQRRYCCKHLSANWKKPFAGPKLWQLF